MIFFHHSKTTRRNWKRLTVLHGMFMVMFVDGQVGQRWGCSKVMIKKKTFNMYVFSILWDLRFVGGDSGPCFGLTHQDSCFVLRVLAVRTCFPVHQLPFFIPATYVSGYAIIGFHLAILCWSTSSLSPLTWLEHSPSSRSFACVSNPLTFAQV